MPRPPSRLRRLREAFYVPPVPSFELMLRDPELYRAIVLAGYRAMRRQSLALLAFHALVIGAFAAAQLRRVARGLTFGPGSWVLLATLLFGVWVAFTIVRNLRRIRGRIADLA